VQPVAGHVIAAVWLARRLLSRTAVVVGVMALSSRSNAEHLRELRKLIKRELQNNLPAQHQVKLLPAQHQVKLDQPALELLKRLGDSDGAVKTLAQLENWCERKKRGSCWRDIVMACIDAERLAREFDNHIEEANMTPKRLGEPRKALAVLRGFLSENKNKSWAVLWGNGAAIERGRDLLDYGIDTEKRVAEETFAQIGATRKTKDKSAPRNAAIWVLAERVKLWTGKRHKSEVATLASEIFEETIDENIVKHAVPDRRSRFNAMQKRRAERLLDSKLTGADFGRIRKGRS
jgi:hypothetical protein